MHTTLQDSATSVGAPATTVQPLVVPGHALVALTGVQRPSAQVRWLERHGWVFFLDAKGHPKVSTAYFLARMSGTLHVAGAQRIEPRLNLFN